MCSVKDFVLLCVLAAVCSSRSLADEGHARPKAHTDNLVEKEHFPEGEHDEDYDHEAFLGDKKDEFDELSPAEAKKRLKVLVKEVDSNKDGFVSEDELADWVKTVFKQRLLEGIEDDLKEKDTDADSKVSWDEYFKSLFGDEAIEDEGDETKEMVRKDKRRFDAADKDKDGKLSKEEYSNFMHPESSEELGDLHVIETIEDIDKNNDGMINMDEFLGDYKDPEDTSSEEPEWVADERNRFNEEYDKNHDGKLSKEEMKLWLLPETDTAMAQEEAHHLVSSADDNKDGKLSETEILKNHHVFVGSDATDYGRALPKHDEF